MTYDVIVFPVIDWLWRLQRPQQIARELARRGHRVFYLTVEFIREDHPRPYLFWSSPEENAYTVQLRCRGVHPNVYKQLPTPEQITELTESLNALRDKCAIGNLVSVVDLPFWHRVASRLQGSLCVYDCMDYHPGFLNNEKLMLDEEDKLIENADLLVTTSASLSDLLQKVRPNVLIRNACEPDHFIDRGTRPVAANRRPVVGYYGAIDHWYDISLVIKAARTYRDWDFVLIGRTHGCDTGDARQEPNIRFVGEVPYTSLPAYVRDFDVAIIPFLINDLTLHTNPVKLYEYLAAGKPVVGTAMTEIMIGGEGLVYVAQTHDEFIALLASAMTVRDNPEFIKKRVAYAAQQTWRNRVDEFEDAILAYFPKVSVVVLTYNNLALTKKCLRSLTTNDEYPNLEIIVVDNGSTDDTPRWLTELAVAQPAIKIILNDANLGFSAGNNVGLKAATGDYLVLLNNDTQVTRGWIIDLLRHLRRDPQIGLIGPVTNNIGNEAKIELNYADDDGMLRESRRYVEARRFQWFSAHTVAFYCAMMSRAVYQAVGELDERFTVGMFEDDDYCRRVQAAGYRIAIADDVFVHHELSAGLTQLGEERRTEIFERNKKVYEAKWGPWIPHQYRAKST